MHMQHGARIERPALPAAGLAGNAAALEQRRIEAVEIGWRKFLQRNAADVAAGNLDVAPVAGKRRRAVLAAIDQRCQPAPQVAFHRVLVAIADAAALNILLHPVGVCIGFLPRIEVPDPLTFRAAGPGSRHTACHRIEPFSVRFLRVEAMGCLRALVMQGAA